MGGPRRDPVSPASELWQRQVGQLIGGSCGGGDGEGARAVSSVADNRDGSEAVMGPNERLPQRATGRPHRLGTQVVGDLARATPGW
jgi:hypothetical protein